jgi:hypothetical protein
VYRRRVLLVAALVAVLAAVAAVLLVISPWSDANHQSAVDVAHNAGIPAGVTPGPQP